MNARTPAESRVEMTEIVLPAHTNRFGTVFGGTIMGWIDICAAVAAQRHSGSLVVTAGMDQLHFLHGARTGDVVTLRASVNCVGTTSMEVGVRVESEDPITRLRVHTATAFLTFVAVDGDGKPQPVPPLEPTNDYELRRQRKGEERRARRLADRNEARARSERTRVLTPSDRTDGE